MEDSLLFRKIDARKINLTHFRLIKMSDAWDGHTTCSDGSTWELLIYVDKVVGKKWAIRNGGSVEQRSGRGKGFWWDMFEISRIYMRILRIARYKFLGGRVVRDETIDTSRPDWDVVSVEPDIWEKLKVHPQFKSMEQQFQLEFTTADQGIRIIVNAPANDVMA